MSSTKLIFTYKRKRLSSCSGAGHVGACRDFALNVEGDKHHATPKESTEKDPMCVQCNDVDRPMDYEGGLQPSNQQVADSQVQHISHEKGLSDCSSLELRKSSFVEKDVQRCDMVNSSETPLGFHVLSEEDACKTSGRETTKFIDKDSIFDLNSNCLNSPICSQNGSVPHSMEDSETLSKQRCLGKVEVGRGKLTAPLLTFSRRLRRKVNAGTAFISDELSIKKDAPKERKCICASTCFCEGASDTRSPFERSDPKVTSNGSDLRRLPCEGGEMTSEEIGDCSRPCTSSCAETLVLRHSEGKGCSHEDLVVDSSTTPIVGGVKISEQTPALSGANALETSNLSKDTSVRTPNDATLSSCIDASKTVEQHASSQCRASSDDSSQLTSSDSSDLKDDAGEIKESKASSVSLEITAPPLGAFVIDCNVVPDSEHQEKELDLIQDSSATLKNDGMVMQEKNKGLQLFRDFDLQVEESTSSRLPSGNHIPPVAAKKHGARYLQLFADDGHCGLSSRTSTNSEPGCSRYQQSASFTVDSGKGQIGQAFGDSDFLSLSLSKEPIYEAQTSTHCLGGHMFRDHHVRIREYIQNPLVQSFPEHASLTMSHKVLLENSNTRATALMGNRNICLDRFEPSPTMWAEEELDSLWIGIRRHGRGNWHAMLLDPRLRFAPWRVARDLADQWECEQYKLLSGQHMPAGRCVKRPDLCNLETHSRFVHPGAGKIRENVSAGTQFSLRDLYAQIEGSYSRSIAAQSWLHNHVTVDSKVGNHSYSSFNTAQASVMIGRDGSSNGRATGSVSTNHLPHWLREPLGTFSMPLEHPSQVPNLPQMGGIPFVHPFPGSSSTSRGQKNLVDPGFRAGELQPPGGSSKGKQSTKDNLVVIDTDASSEETVSDDHNIQN